MNPEISTELLEVKDALSKLRVGRRSDINVVRFLELYEWFRDPPPQLDRPPSAEWTVQQFREALPGSHAYQYLIHDRDRIFSKELDKEITTMGVRVLRTPVRRPERMQCANVSAGRCAANVWTSSFRSMSVISDST
jgi:hypothetical protein